MQHKIFKRNLETLLTNPCRPWLWLEEEPGVLSSGYWRQFYLVAPSGAPPLLLVLLMLRGVGKTTGPCWRAGLEVAVLNSGSGSTVVVLEFRLAEGKVSHDHRQVGGMVTLVSMLDGGLVILS